MEKIRSYERELVSQIEKLREKYEVIELGKLSFSDSTYPYFAIRIPGKSERLPNIHIHGSIHGNEPAGAYAILKFLLEGRIEPFRDFFNFTIIPSANPSGFERDIRGNGNRVDLNRNFSGPVFEQETVLTRSFIESENKQYVAVLELHEDKTDEEVEGFPMSENPTGAYLYEMLPRNEADAQDSLGRIIIDTLRDEGVPIWEGEMVYADRSDRGVIQEGFTQEGVERPTHFDGFVSPRTRYEITFETPTVWELSRRVDFQMQFLEVTLEELKKKI